MMVLGCRCCPARFPGNSRGLFLLVVARFGRFLPLIGQTADPPEVVPDGELADRLGDPVGERRRFLLDPSLELGQVRIPVRKGLCAWSSGCSVASDGIRRGLPDIMYIIGTEFEGVTPSARSSPVAASVQLG